MTDVELAKEALRRLLSQEKQAAPHVGMNPSVELFAPNPFPAADAMPSGVVQSAISRASRQPISISGMQLMKWQQAKPPAPEKPVGVPFDLDPNNLGLKRMQGLGLAPKLAPPANPHKR